MEKARKIHRELILSFVIIAGSTFLFLTSLYSFLLFHLLVELFTVLIAFSIFVIAWSSRKYIDNVFLFLIGSGYLFVGILDLFHALSYDGMGLIRGYGANLPTQLWIAARYLEAASFIGAFLFLAVDNGRAVRFIKKRSYEILFFCGALFLAIIIAIFYLKIFPEVYIEGQGMTPFKIYSEYIISFLFLVAIILLFKKREKFDSEMINPLSMALIMKIFSELAFTQYIGVYDFSNVLGHVFRFISFVLLYKAIFEVGLDKPYEFLFLNLKKSEERYRSLVEFSPDPIVVHRKGIVLYANKLAKNFFGVKGGGDVVGAKVVDLFQPKYKEKIEYRMKKIFKGEWRKTPRAEMEAINREGKIVPVEVKGMKIIYEGKDAVESIVRDISERRGAEKRIRSLAQFPEENPNPVIRATGDGQVQYANKPAREMLASLNWEERKLLPEPLLSSVKTALEKKERPKLELECSHGRIYFIELAPSFTDGHINLYGRDITEIKIAEKKLAETQAELRGRIEEQLVESYKHMGMVNRKMSLLLDVGENIGNKKNKQEVSDYIVNSAISLSGAKIGMLYISSGKNHFSLISNNGLSEENKKKINIVSRNNFNFINKLSEEKRRVNNPVEFEESGTFEGNIDVSYFVALPILKADVCRGFLFLGFKNRRSMDGQELEFLDVFSRHISSALVDSGIVA